MHTLFCKLIVIGYTIGLKILILKIKNVGLRCLPIHFSLKKAEFGLRILYEQPQ